MLLEMALFHSFQLSHPLSAAALINSLDGFELMFVLQQNHVIKCEKKTKQNIVIQWETPGQIYLTVFPLATRNHCLCINTLYGICIIQIFVSIDNFPLKSAWSKI